MMSGGRPAFYRSPPALDRGANQMMTMCAHPVCVLLLLPGVETGRPMGRRCAAGRRVHHRRRRRQVDILVGMLNSIQILLLLLH